MQKNDIDKYSSLCYNMYVSYKRKYGLSNFYKVQK